MVVVFIRSDLFMILYVCTFRWYSVQAMKTVQLSFFLSKTTCSDYSLYNIHGKTEGLHQPRNWRWFTWTPSYLKLRIDECEERISGYDRIHRISVGSGYLWGLLEWPAYSLLYWIHREHLPYPHTRVPGI